MQTFNSSRQAIVGTRLTAMARSGSSLQLSITDVLRWLNLARGTILVKLST
jgi:hypothetical protein